SGFAARFIWHYAAPYFLHFNQQQFDLYGYWPHRFRLATHIGGGVIALICGTLQLWTGFGVARKNFHSWDWRGFFLGAGCGNSWRLPDGGVHTAEKFWRRIDGPGVGVDSDDRNCVGSNFAWPSRDAQRMDDAILHRGICVRNVSYHDRHASRHRKASRFQS